MDRANDCGLLLGRMRNVPSSLPLSSLSASVRLQVTSQVFSSLCGDTDTSTGMLPTPAELSSILSMLWWLSPLSMSHLQDRNMPKSSLTSAYVNRKRDRQHDRETDREADIQTYTIDGWLVATKDRGRARSILGHCTLPATGSQVNIKHL